MINKPINLSPYNACVVSEKDFHIKYDIPNAKVNGCVTFVNELSNGNNVLVHRENFDEPTSQIDLNIGQRLLQEILLDSQDIVLNSEGNFEFSFDEDICLNVGDVIDVEIKNTGTTTTHSLSLYGSPISFDNISEGDWSIKNDSMPNGVIIAPNIEYSSGATITILVSHENKGEYSWNSFYWQTPTKETDVRVVAGVDSNTNKIFLQPTIDSFSEIYAEYNMHGDTGCFFNETLFLIDSGYYSKKTYEDGVYHSSDESEDTSKYCYSGQLPDYYGYRYVECMRDVMDKILDIDLGKCIVELYDFENKLVTRFRVLAYDVVHYTSISNVFRIIVDNESVNSQMNKLEELGVYTGAPAQTGLFCWKYNYAKFYNIDDINSQEKVDGLMQYEDNYYILRNGMFENHQYSASVYPFLSNNIQIGDEIKIWGNDIVESNITPSSYFRYKTTPKYNIHNCSGTPIQNGKFNDVNIEFDIWSYDNPIDYFYLYLYAYNEENSSWTLIERSPMLRAQDTYKFIGLIDKKKYKVNAVITDIDNDEWNSQDMIFTIDNPAIITQEVPAIFDKKNSTIAISLNNLLGQYYSAELQFYKYPKNDVNEHNVLVYAGGGIAKTFGSIIFNQWVDYNICNDTYYDYYIRVSYSNYDGSTGICWVCAATNIHTDFEGTSILGLEKTNNEKIAIVKSFDILYHFDNKYMGDLKNELSREYIDTLSKYPRELKGHQNYISGSTSGLLGTECNGVYEEPRGLRKAWNNFVDDDTIKLYRGIDGETMIIGIDSNMIKPSYFPNVGIVNEVSITFKEIDSANKYAIFSTSLGNIGR